LEVRALLSFYAPVDYPIGPDPQASVTASFRGNGILDLAQVDANDGTVMVLLGNGDGTFRPAVAYPTGGSAPIRLVAGEFRTGSGILDLVVGNRGSNTIGILRGNGDGTFQSPITIGGFSGPQVVAAGDFNQDGNLDLAVTNVFSNTVSILLGNGDGTFQSSVTYTTFSQPRDLLTSDLRHNGKVDLVVTPEEGSDHPNDIMVLLGNGDGTFQDPVSYHVSQPANLAVGEFRTGSGILDLAVTDRYNNTVSVLLGNGDGTFQAPVTYPVGDSSSYPTVNVGDFNHDGIIDLVVTNFGGSTVSVLLGNGDGTFQAPLAYNVGSQPVSTAVGDFNGDSYDDLAVSNHGSSTISVLINDRNWSGGGGSGGRAELPDLPALLSWSVQAGSPDRRNDGVPGSAVQTAEVVVSPAVVAPAAVCEQDTGVVADHTPSLGHRLSKGTLHEPPERLDPALLELLAVSLLALFSAPLVGMQDLAGAASKCQPA
jgi:hypothetical protein